MEPLLPCVGRLAEHCRAEQPLGKRPARYGGVQTDVSDLVKPVREDVSYESTDEFHTADGYRLAASHAKGNLFESYTSTRRLFEMPTW